MAIRVQELQVPEGRDAVVYPFPRRLPHRRRVPAGMLIAFATVLGLAAGSWEAPAPPTAPAASRSVVVEPGETLWSIALEQAPQGSDVRSYVDRIVALNGGRATVAPGVRLRLPH